MVQKVRFGVVGAGNIGVLHLENIHRRLDEGEVVALAEARDNVLEEVSARYGVRKTYRDYRDLAEDEDVDAVIVSLPNFMHREAVKAFVKKGKHVLCEKPMSITLEEADDIVATVDRHRTKFQVGYNRRFDEAYAKAKGMIAKGELGTVTLARSNTRDPVPPAGWEKDPKLSGNIFLGTCAHDFDSLRWLIGCEVREVYASQAFLVYEDLERLGYPDNVMIMLKFESGAMAEVDASRNCAYGYDVRTEVFGTKGALRIEKDKALDLLIFSKGDVRHDYPYWFNRRFQSSYLEEVRAFAKCILEDSVPSVTARDGRAVVEIGVAATESAQSGESMKLPMH